MKKLLQLLFIVLITFGNVIADPIDVNLARSIGSEFLQTSVGMTMTNGNDLVLVKTYYFGRSTAAFYIFNSENGFVIVSADDCATPILGYSYEGQFDAENIPVQMEEYFNGFLEQIQYGVENHLKDAGIAHQWELIKATGTVNDTKNNRSVSPMLTDIWEQGCYYNNRCPEDDWGDCGHVVTGCTGTAMGQILRYWGFPTIGSGKVAYTPNGYPRQVVDFSQTIYDWDNMVDELTDMSSEEEIDAVATLLWHCGVSLHAIYGAWGTSAYPSHVPGVLQNIFNYSNDLYGQSKSDNAAWLEQVKANLDDGMPLHYSAWYPGHSFVCDGYDADDNLHFNWGWGGYGNGFFALTALNVGGYSFNSSHYAVFGIRPSNISFDDENVKNICVSNWDTNGDGELGYDEAAAVTDLGTVFSNNTNITSFNELQYFIGLNSIAGDAFNGCSNLSSVTIPLTVSSIGDYAFYNCSGITEISVNAKNAPTLEGSKNTNVFTGVNKNITVNIPCGSLTSYQLSTGWNEFTRLVQFNPYYNPVGGNQYSMNVIGVINIDGVEQNTTTLEIGAFCGNECRGRGIGQLVQSINRYLVLVSIGSDVENGEEITFRLYDHEMEQELDINCVTTVNFVKDDILGSHSNPFEFNFVDKVIVSASANPSDGGVVTGAGEYGIGESVTLTATANDNYIFTNWTEGNDVVSTNSTYTFTAETNRTLVANFSQIQNHWTPVGGDDYPYTMTVSGILLIDGVVQNVTTYEIGAFCGDECRGSARAQLFSSTGEYVIPLVIHGGEENGDIISFRIYDHVLQQEPENLRCFTTLEYVKDGIIGTPGNWYQFSFLSQVEVTVTIVPENGGTVTGTGLYPLGSTATLMAFANDGFAFHNWERDMVVVSENNPYTFTVNESIHLTLNFYYVETIPLGKNWNWWSTTIEMEGVDGLTMLENSLGDLGIIIKSQNEFVGNVDNVWEGNLENIENEQGYLILMSAAGNSVMTGNVANPADHPITIISEWTWIGYPVTVAQTPEVAMSGFTPALNDIVKGRDYFAGYYEGEGWWPEDFYLVPGQGYMYHSNSSEPKVLTYVNAGSKNNPYIVKENHFWENNNHSYPYNFNVIAAVNVADIEQRGDNLELGAFVNGECRGSAKLKHFKPLDRYYAMLTVAGEDGELVEFGLVDAENNRISSECENEIAFVSNAIYGSFDNPYVFNFKDMKDMCDYKMELFPNPVERNQSFTMNLPPDETVKEIFVTNAVGALVEHMVSKSKVIERCVSVAGVYMVKVVCVSGNVYWGKLIVK